jgi:hypothetical protein
MAKKQITASETSPVRATAPSAKKTSAPVAKRTIAAKHSKAAPKTVAPPVVVPEVKIAVPAAKQPKQAKLANAMAVEVPKAKTPAPSVEITRDQIAARAYQYWVSRGYQGGDPVADWLRAEAELKNQIA